MKLFIFFFFSIYLYSADICLSLVIKNDEAVIENCLKSVKNIIDCISVCDTGSTDKTVEIIEAFMKESGIPGKIERHPWKNWGHNRTLAVLAAQETLKQKGFSLSETYLLILDPNMVVHPEESFDTRSLNKDAYLLLEKSSLLSCYNFNLRLLKASIPWKSYGVTHEYWAHNAGYQCEKLRSLMIEDQGDSQERIKNDIHVMKQQLIKEPDNERYIFYLAQSLKSLKQYEEASSWYKKRIELKGDIEEIWFSKYMLGECYKELGNWESALFWYLEAYQYNPDRTDSLLSVATYYRKQGQNDLAYIFTSYSSQIPRTEEQIFFNNPPNNHYRFDEELSIAAYYTRFRGEGFKAASNLVLTRDVPWNVKNQTYRNLLFYVQNLPNTRFKPILFDFPLIKKGFQERYHPMNPSILKTKNGYKVICRTVNYTQTGAKIFNTIESSGIFRSRNFLLDYDQNFNLLSQYEITENLTRERIRSWISTAIKGLDDCRIFDFKGKTWFTCTTGDTNPTGNFQISLCSLGEEEIGRVDKLTPLLGPDPNRCEKNWLPFIKNNELHLIYSYDPFVIYKPHPDTGVCEKVLSYKPALDLSTFRGSAAPIPFDGGYLMVIHEVVHRDDHTRRYLHRFVFLDQDFMIQKISNPFIFREMGIEFCCSMTLDHSEKELILTLGVEDREAYLCFLDLGSVRALLHP